MSKKAGVWVLTTEFNDYDQHGAYLEAIWQSKPTIEQLAKHFKYLKSEMVGSFMGALEFILHIQKGGGRQGTEHQWYNLEFMEFEQ